MALLKALFLPRKLSIIHCPGHQKGDAPEARGNRLADTAAREAAKGLTSMASQAFPLQPEAEASPETPSHGLFRYTKEDTDLLKTLGASFDFTKGRWDYAGKPVMPIGQTFELISYLHKLTHLSRRKMKALLDREENIYHLLGKDAILQQVTDSCKACAQVNAGRAKVGIGVRMRGHRPGIH